MIKLSPQQLTVNLASALGAYQANVNSGLTYENRVTLAKRLWESKSSATFLEIRALLAAMCSGNRRCVYCEDSLADEVEHMRPKDLYPDQVFLWDNYVFACGPCNGPKNNQFAIMVNGASLLDVTRKRNGPVVPPPQGPYALIDPRIEDPVDWLWLDFRTGRYVPNFDDEQSVDYVRADYTIGVLGLNVRDDLVRGRSAAISGFESRLVDWDVNHATWSVERRCAFAESFKIERYRGVWSRMKAHCAKIDQLANVARLIAKHPEIATW